MTEAALFYESARPGLGALNTLSTSLIYAIESNELIVIAVAHQRRSPNYWKVRR